MILDRDQVTYEIALLGLPTNVKKLADGRADEVHSLLAVQCSETKIVYEEDVTPFQRRITPLWEKDGVICAVWVVDGKREFIQFDIHCPDEYELLGYSINSVISRMLAWLLIELDKTPSIVIEIAELLEFPSPDDFVFRVEERYDETAEDYEEWLHSFSLAFK